MIRDTSKLTVGQEVAWGWKGTYGVNQWHFNKITKITATGQVTLDNGKRFKNDGYEMGTNGYRGVVLEDADLARNETLLALEQAELNRRVNQLKTLIEQRRTGHGDYRLDDEQKKAMVILTETLNAPAKDAE